MIEQFRRELLELAAAIRESDQHRAILRRLDHMELRLLAAIKEPAKINLEPLTAELKAANDSLEATVKANQP